jgi:hypothetical protein
MKMGQLNAFIGHSFTADDKDIVRTFLKFFDTVKNMNIGFSWEHAEIAEPKDLREKVLKLIEGKNLFIGICTNKEATIHPSKLKKNFFGSLNAAASDFESKTSDWIIQEIGLAIGLKMELILLVENGVRKPGGLQGDLEYINFDRNAPERTFEKILEMIQSLMPKARMSVKVENDVQVMPNEENDENDLNDGEYLQPQPHWDKRKYEFALMYAMALDNKECEERINSAYLRTEEGGLHENKVSWAAFYEHRRIFVGKGGSLENLKRIVNENPGNPVVLKFLGMGYRIYEDFERSASCFKQASDIEDKVVEKIDYLSECVDSFIRARKYEDAKLIIREMEKFISHSEDLEAKVIKTLRNIADSEGKEDVFLGLTERFLQLKPDDIDARFNLAFKYSKLGLGGLSLAHYLKIPSQERNSATWNNLGVQFDHLELFKKSVDSYRRAESMGETLAMSNLAQKLIKIGFISEAEELCVKAAKIENYHKNVSHTISKIKDIPEEENKKETEIIENSKAVSLFYMNYGYSITKEALPNYLGLKQGPSCQLNIKVDGGQFIAEGSYTQADNSLGLRGILSGSSTVQQKSTTYIVRYEGAVEGRTASGIYTKRVEGESGGMRGFLGVNPNEIRILMIFSDNFEDITVYEKNGLGEGKIYPLKNIPGEG